MPHPRSRSLLVTFDAFGTLFSPRQPVPHQYAQVAKECGVIVDPNDVQESFIAAYNAMCAEFPNYGKASGMRPETWWKILVNRTFHPLIPSRGSVPRSLPPALVAHFASASAYTLHPIVPSLLHRLRSFPLSSRHPAPTTVGIISNSDPRVPFIIRDLGVAIKHYQTSAPEDSNAHLQDTNDRGDGTGSVAKKLSKAQKKTVAEMKGREKSEWSVPEGTHGAVDFLTLSYDVGVSKPDEGIFKAAEKMALDFVGEGADAEWELVRKRVEDRDVGEEEEAKGKRGKKAWRGKKVHVGDEWKKDVEAARGAGWEGVLWRDDITVEEITEKILGPEEEEEE